jgi:hypothetical protein
MPSPQGTNVQLSMGAQLEQNSMIILIVLVVLFWPAAAILGYLAYSEFETKKRALYAQFWQHMFQTLGAPAQALPATGYAPGYAAAPAPVNAAPGYGPPPQAPPGGYRPPGQ